MDPHADRLYECVEWLAPSADRGHGVPHEMRARPLGVNIWPITCARREFVTIDATAYQHEDAGDIHRSAKPGHTLRV